MAKKVFKELSRAKIQDERFAVISLNGLGNITIAQAAIVKEGNSNKSFDLFMKGAFFVDKDKLIDLRDSINEAVLRLDTLEETEEA